MTGRDGPVVPESWARPPQETRAVLVPAILAAGLLFSMVTWVRDLLHRWRRRRERTRRAVVFGAGTGVLTLAGPDAARADPALRRSRATEAVVSLAAWGFAVYLVLGSWGNYRGWTRWSEGIAWLWALFLVAAAAAATVGTAALVLAASRRPPAWARAFRGATPLARSVAGSSDAPPDPGSDPERRRPLGPHVFSDRTAHLLRGFAAVWGVVAVATFTVFTITDRIPTSPEGDTLGDVVAGPAAYTLLALAALGVVLERRHTEVGAVLLAVAAGGLGLLSAIQYPPAISLAVAAVFAVPPFLSWLAWQRRSSARAIAALATVTAVLLAGVGVGATRVYDHYYGPAHPQSPVAALPDSAVEWIWAGGTTDSAVTVVAGLRGEAPASARLAMSDDADFASPRWSERAEATDEEHRAVRFTVDGLDPDRTYHYAVEVDGELDLVAAGTFRTFPVGPSSFTMAVSACARTGSNGAVFDTIRERDPLAFLITGDLNYGNVPDDDPGQFRYNLERGLTTPAQSALYRATSIAYVWDDHDYGANDGNRTSPSRPAAHLVYREMVPHHPLALGDEGPIGQSFRAGRVTFVVTDLRSDRDPPGDPAGAELSMMGAEQRRWFEAELAAAADRGDAVVWVNPTPWIATASPGSDTWAGYAAEREQIADVIADLGLLDRFVVLSGDAHMVALDDGANSDYSSSRAGGFPLLQAAALDRPGSVKGGPYSSPTFPGGGQFGEIAVVDDGASMTITLRGLTWQGEVLVEESFPMVLPPVEPAG